MDISAQYTRLRKDGDIPMGMAFGSSGNNFLEVLQPIDQTIHELRLSGTWAKEKWQLQFAYTLSVFENDLAFMRADNPCASTTAPPRLPARSTPAARGDLGGPQFGTMSLPPNNLANTFSLSGGVNLPGRTRINGNVTYSFWLQNQDFLPQTFTNSLPATVPSVMLPEKSLHGNVQNVLINVTATSRPCRCPSRFTAKYRYYNLMDESSTPTFTAFLVNDGHDQPGADEGRPLRLHAPGRERGWPLPDPSVARVHDGRRLGPDATEQYPRGAPDQRLLRQGCARLDAVQMGADPSDVRALVPADEPSTAPNCLAGQENWAEPGEPGQSYLLRKFDEADLNQQSANLMLQLTPIEWLCITPSLNYTNQDFIASGLFDNSSYQGPAEGNVMLGVQQVTSWSAGIDLNWKPTDRITFTAATCTSSGSRRCARATATSASTSRRWTGSRTSPTPSRPCTSRRSPT